MQSDTSDPVSSRNTYHTGTRLICNIGSFVDIDPVEFGFRASFDTGQFFIDGFDLFAWTTPLRVEMEDRTLSPDLHRTSNNSSVWLKEIMRLSVSAYIILSFSCVACGWKAVSI